MLSAVRKLVGVLMLAAASLAVSTWAAASRANETVPAPNVDQKPADEKIETPTPADETLPLTESPPAAADTVADSPNTESTSGNNPGDDDATPRLFDPSAGVKEFARKLSEQLDAHAPRKQPKPRSAWNAALREEMCPGDCPVCGGPLGQADDYTMNGAHRQRSRWQKIPHVDWLFQNLDAKDADVDESTEPEEKLQPGEPAEVILELREKLGNSALKGSEFTVKPEAFAKWVRALDRELSEQESQRADASEQVMPAPVEPSLDADEATISALRAASRQLDDAAELLEQQNLFERADELREQADRLRRDARAYLKERAVPAANERTEYRAKPTADMAGRFMPLDWNVSDISLAKFLEAFELRHGASPNTASIFTYGLTGFQR